MPKPTICIIESLEIQAFQVQSIRTDGHLNPLQTDSTGMCFFLIAMKQVEHIFIPSLPSEQCSYKFNIWSCITVLGKYLQYFLNTQSVANVRSKAKFIFNKIFYKFSMHRGILLNSRVCLKIYIGWRWVNLRGGMTL